MEYAYKYRIDNFPISEVDLTSPNRPELVHFTVQYEDSETKCEVGIDAFVWRAVSGVSTFAYRGFTKPEEGSGEKGVFNFTLIITADFHTGLAKGEMMTDMVVRPAGVKINA